VRRLRGQEGFSLVELVAAMFVLGILFAIFATVFGSAIRHDTQIEGQTLFQSEARGAVDRLARDFRQASNTDASVSRIATMTSTQLTFYSPDAATPFHLRELSYRVAGGELDRQIAFSTNTGGPPWTMGSFSPWSKEVGNVASTTAFTYLDANGAVTAVPASVASVVVSLTLATVLSPTRQFTYSATVTLRTSQ